MKKTAPEKQSELSLREQKQAEKALIQEYEFSQSLLENMADGVVACDAEGTLTLFNRTAREWHGLDPIRIPQEEWGEYYNLFRADGVTPLPTEEIPLAMAFRGEIVKDVDMAIVAKGQAPRFIQANGSIIISAKGQKLGAVVVMRDITLFKQLEHKLLLVNEDLEKCIWERTAELEKATSNFNEAQRIAHIGSWELDLKNNILTWSDEIFRIFEIDPEKFTATYEAFLETIHPDDREAVNDAYTSSLEKRSPYSIEHRLLFPDGRIKFVNEQCETYYENGKPVRSIGTVQNITERKQSENEMHRLNRELRAISNCNQTLMKAEDEQELLTDICRIICDDTGYKLAWVGYAEHDPEKTIRPMAWAGDNADEYVTHAYLSWSEETEKGRGPAGMVIRSGETLHVRDFATDQRMAPWRKSALALGFRSGIALPLREQNDFPFGVLLLYTDEPSVGTPEEIELMEKLASDLAFGITVLRNRIRMQQTEDELKEKQRLLLEAQHMAHIGNWWHDLVTGEIFWSDEFFCILGIQPQKPTAEMVHSIIHPDDLPILLKAMEESAAGKMEHEHDFRIIRPDGEIRWVHNHWIRINDENGNEVKRVGTHQDITDRKNNEKERLRHTAIIEQTADSIIITDRNGLIQYVNPSFERITGYSAAEVIGKNPKILQSGHHSPQFYQEMWNTLTEGKVWQGHLINKKKDDTILNEEVSITPVLDDNGKIINYVALEHDVTEQKKLESQLHQAHKMEAIGTLAGGIAHDFNNILGAISGYAEIAKDEIDNPELVLHDLDQVLLASQRAKELVKQILTFSRSTANQKLQPLQIQLVVKEALKLLRSSIPTTIEITIDIESGCQPVLADPTQIHQIIMNICTNSYHAMRETGGVLAVSLAPVELDKDFSQLPPGSYLRLEIKDTGHGMAKDVLDRIFEPYFTTKETGEGTGLGLSVVHGIVTSLQGDIEVYSKLNMGTTVRIFLPVAPSVTENIQKETSTILQSGSEKILFVDDEVAITRISTKMLESLGYKVTALTSSTDALTLFQKDPDNFDLVITDMTMPNLTGAELSRHILTIRPDMKIILCTGFSDLINEEQALALGIRGYIMKPLVKYDLASAVREVLDTSLTFLNP